MKKWSKQERFINRELSWVQFNERVLEEARDAQNPLLERLRFLAITANNLDEFFSVRIASLKKMLSVDYKRKDISGMSAKDQLNALNEVVHQLVKQQYSTWNLSLKRLLSNEKISLLAFDELTPTQQDFVEDYFQQVIFPVLTPMAVDLSRPFPLITSASLNIALLLSKKEKGAKKNVFATLQIPKILPRVVSLPAQNDEEQAFILLEEIVRNYLLQFFSGYQVEEAACYRIMRDMDIDIAEKDSDDFLRSIEEELLLKDRRKPIRLEIESTASKHLRKKLTEATEIENVDVYKINGPLDLNFLSKLVSQIEDHKALRFESFKPYYSKEFQEKTVFQLLKEKDVFLHHPYDSFQPVIQMVKEAAEDEQVLAIKMTLYRVSGDSPVIHYLRKAAENGKQVTVLVEVKARFDEENNIHWAQELEKSGCHVIYGLVGLKTHCKVLLVVRREDDGIQRYLHMGTGNYNDSTAKLYTDMGLMTTNEQMGQDATNLFNMLSGYSEPDSFNKYVIAPLYLRSSLKQLIEGEIKAAKKGRPAAIKMKMNSLCDAEIIDLLYQASQVGITVELIIRGICSLRAQVPELSENITVHSIVGRLLEHSRIYYFASQDKLFLSSADAMPRNLNKRVELMFPIDDPQIKTEILDTFQLLFEDTEKTRSMKENGRYKRIDKRGLKQYNAQEILMDRARAKALADKKKEKAPSRFQPIIQENGED